MLLDPRQFEKFLGSNAKGRPKIRYAGNGVLLNLDDVRTFGGVVRFYHDGKGNPITTGAQTQPIRIRNPVRLPELGTFKLMFHLHLKKALPKDVVAYITPTPEMASAGLMISQEWLKTETELWASALTMRRIEVEIGYPMGLLLFTLEQESKVKGVKEKKNEDSAPTPEE